MNWNETIIGNAISAIIGSVVTYVLTTICEKKKQKRQEEKEMYKNKPEIIVTKANFINEDECEMQLLVAQFIVDKNNNFSYSKKYKNKNEYIFKDYILKNIGKTPIEELEVVTTNKKYNSVFDINSADIFMENGLINYGWMWDRKIFPDQELKLRLYFHKEMIITSSLLAPFIIQYNGSNGLYWEQAFFESEYKIYSPMKISHKQYKDNISTKKAMECFEKPWLW